MSGTDGRRGVVPVLGSAAAFAIVVANMVGQGVFLKGRVMACQSGSPALELAAWALAGAIALFGALSFAELATMMPQSGGTYVYVRRAFGRPVAFTIGWAQLAIAAPASIGALASGGAIFFDRATNGALDAVPHGMQWFAAALVVVVTAINCLPVRANGVVAIASASIKLFTLAGLAIAGFVLAGHGAGSGYAGPRTVVAACPDVPPPLLAGVGGFAAALLSALYAYNGWIVITSVAGEIRRPSVVIPRALFASVSLVVGLYVVANAAFIRTLGFATIEHLAPTGSIGIAAAQTLFGARWATFASVVLLLSVVATLHVVVLNFSRITYATAAGEPMFAPLAKVSRSGVPVAAVIATSALALVLVLLAGFERLSDLFTLEVWLIFVVAVAGLFVLRRSEPATPRPYRVLGYPFVPAAFLIVATYVLATTALTRPLDAGLALAITLAGFPLYAAVFRLRAPVR